MNRMTVSPTLPELSAPWDKPAGARKKSGYRLVIAWSFDEPARIGESAAITGEGVLGRGGPQADDPSARVVFHRRRPDHATPCPPLDAARISRAQLALKATAEGLHVRSIGKCTLMKNGLEESEATFAPGDVLTLKNALVLYVTTNDDMPSLRSDVARELAFGEADSLGIVGEGPEAWRLRDELAFVAASPHHVLVFGESGTGKELAARAIHVLSSRHEKTLVARNAATIPSGLVDAELFGTAKNYPNAGSPERVGLLGEANGSTLFLDEIGELPPEVQAHLLRVLDRDGEYQRLGESTVRRSDVRVVAATNRDASALKHDFLARFPARIAAPPLTVRREDIPLLVRHLLTVLAAKMPNVEKLQNAQIEPALIEVLLRHEYTHHLRELDRLLWLAVSTSTADFIALTEAVEKEVRLPVEERAGEPSKDDIEKALSAAGGNVTRAAERLTLPNRFALYRLMKKHGL